MKDYLIGIKKFLTIAEIDSLKCLKEQESDIREMARLSIAQSITNVVELNRALSEDYDLIPKYIIRTRNIASHSYHELDFGVVWKFIEKDLDKCLVGIDLKLEEGTK